MLNSFNVFSWKKTKLRHNVIEMYFPTNHNIYIWNIYLWIGWETDIKPGEQGYKQAALNNRITSIDLLKTNNQRKSSYDGIINGGSIISTFMIVDGTMEEAITGEAKVLFSQLGANPNNTDSVRMLGDNIFGFEADHNKHPKTASV